jgi:NAD(P)-dependent dehydrogenase (short-subunit alcohol dehydrogenase family)
MKTVIVTGGNRGIGFEICRQLDKHGFRVILCSRILQNGIDVSRHLSKNVIVKQVDVTDTESIKKLYLFINSEIGSLDILINNAGIGENIQPIDKITGGIKKAIKENFNGAYNLIKKSKPFLAKARLALKENRASNIQLEDVKRIMETNFFGAWRMIQTFVPLLSKSGSGKIINVSSGMGEINSLTGFYPGYSLSKTSLNALTIMFSNELREKGIKVNAVCPGWVKSDMGGPDAPRSLNEGADTAIWLSTEDNIPTGYFFKDRKIINW